jgi:hypothetical protein
LIGFTIKNDFCGVTSIARGVGLAPNYYTCLLHFFSSTAINLEKLQILWANLIVDKFKGIVRVNGRFIIVGDGIKIGKEGKKMPGVKLLHQDSESNSKAEYIMGHSIQVAAILAAGLNTVFAIPLVGKIHEGIRLYSKNPKTLLDKMFTMLIELKLPESFYFVADKYYCSGRFMKQLIEQSIHLVTMMKKNAVAYYPAETVKNSKGRPKKYGTKVKLFDLFNTELNLITAPMPGNDKIIIKYCCMQFFWRPLGALAQFVFVCHPEKGNAIVMSTDLTLSPLDMILIYSLRFKIEVLFKQAVHQVGTFMYRFWLKIMLPKKRGSGDQYIQFEPKDVKAKIFKKLASYHLFIQLGLIAQGLIQYLSLHYYQDVWSGFGTWLRTIRKNVLPSEKVVSMAMGKSYFAFLEDTSNSTIFEKFKFFLRGKTNIRQLRSVIARDEIAA